jgi:hypothetical protein
VIDEKDDLLKMVAEFQDVFCGDGRLEGDVVIEIDENTTPSQEKPRKSLMAVGVLLARKLEQLEKRKITKQVFENSDWTSNIVIVRRKDKIRVCLDPHNLMQAIKRCLYQIPTVEEILPELTPAKIFSILDAKLVFGKTGRKKQETDHILSVACQIQIFTYAFWYKLSTIAEIYQQKQHQV